MTARRSSSPGAQPAPMRVDTLTPRERLIVEVVSVFYEGIPRTDLAKALGRLGERERGRAPYGHEILPLLEALAERGWLVDGPQWRLSPERGHAVMRAAAEAGRLASIADVVRSMRPAIEGGAPAPRTTWWTLVRELRIEVYSGRWDDARALVRSGMFREICRPFDRAWVEGLPADLRGRALMDVLDESLETLSPAHEALEVLEDLYVAEPAALTDGGHHLLVDQLTLRGRAEDATRIAAERSSVNAQVYRAALLALAGRWREAIPAYERALTAFVKQAGKRHPFFPDRAGLFFLVSLLADGTIASLSRAKALAAAAQRKGVSAYPEAAAILAEAASILAGEKDADEALAIASELGRAAVHPVTLLLSVCAAVWVGKRVPADVLSELTNRARAADAAGYHWLATQSAEAVLVAGGKDGTGHLSALHARLVGVSLARAVTRKERWAEALDALAELAAPARSPRERAASTPETGTRLVWVVTSTPHWVDVSPREQSRTKGVWSKGRPVALARLAKGSAAMEFLTAADRAVCAAIEEHVQSRYYGRYQDVSYALDAGAALRALAGAPNVVTEIDGALVPVEVRLRAARLVLERTGARDAGFRLRLDPTPRSPEESTVIVRAGPTTIELVELDERHRAIAKALGKAGLELPRAAEARLREILAALSRIIPSDADLSRAPSEAGDAPASELVDADPTLTLIARPLGQGLSLQPVVRPMGPRGPAVPPGVGGAAAFAEIEGRRVRCQRDLAEERRRLEAVLAACPSLALAESSTAGHALRDRELALTTLLELRAAGALLEWPEGESLRVADAMTIDRLALATRAVGDAFDLDGALEVPGGRPIPLSTVLTYLDASPGRFVKLDEDHYLALTEDMRRRLDELRSLGELSRSRLRIHRLVVAELEDLLAGARIDGDEGWRLQRERLTSDAGDARVPVTFRGELRPFQEDGFRWLARLGRWGAGACLADEMGLGKTVQALALLLHRAPEGPSLVVAPTSVLSSWAEQAARFAPTLRIRVHTGELRERERRSLGPFDVLLTSYALLAIDVEVLAPISFVVAVLDEAQHVKNADSQRARAAAVLTAEQRVVMTGTPIENRLEDLWSLFRFANPGLLGTRAGFEARFGRAIEERRDRAAREGLRRRVRPFLLRRTKGAVLDELPARTEVTLRVALAPRELALYEVIRAEALRGLDAERAGAKRRMHLLAAITRLRRAACSERLVRGKETAAKASRARKPPEAAHEPSAKLEALGELLDDILPSGHKALVFSQFVDHLALVRELLEARGISHLYLDGGTPAAKRKEAIDAFQAGRAHVFLISLKAGGFGLNLTAADYVVHMDPWWNPAVEDQASDRAHRMGQLRPVTIYRLVAKDTIEDRIVALHHDKRALADALLDGAEAPAGMTEDEMLELIRAR